MDNKKFMRQALELSLKAKGLTSPNPLVGALVVRNGKVISRGFHKKAGSQHAEIEALNKAGEKAKNATLYVTLEPCSTFGRTPPCTDLIIKKGIKKVVVGMVDPNPSHKGNGLRVLKKSKIEIVSGVLKDEIARENQPFIKYITKGLPYVTVKIAQSIDGKIATKTGESKWITSKASRGISHKLRNNFDAIVVGINTVLKDNPLLNPLNARKNKSFYKIVADTNLKILNNLRIFKDSKQFPVIVATAKENILRNKHKISKLIKKGAIILGVNKKKDCLDLNDLLKSLSKFKFSNILVEGGGKLIGSFLDNNLVDFMYVFIAAKIIGGEKAISSIQGEGLNNLACAKEIKDLNFTRIGSDLLLKGRIKEY